MFLILGCFILLSHLDVILRTLHLGTMNVDVLLSYSLSSPRFGSDRPRLRTGKIKADSYFGFSQLPSDFFIPFRR